MNIYVNDEVYDVLVESALDKILLDLKIESKGVAVALNETVIPKSNWASTKINENDKILIIKATQGG